MTLKRTQRFLCAATLAVTAALVAAPANADKQTLDEILRLEQDGHKFAQQAQRQVNNLADETADLLDKYRSVMEQVRKLKVYNRQLESLIADQQKQIASLQRQIESITSVNRSILPLIQDMILSLADLVENDVPLFKEERINRIARLQSLITDSSVSTSEKYRQVMAAYEIENMYGRTMNAYQGSIELEGGTPTVNFVHVGRIALMYQTKDGDQSGVWNKQTKQWEELPSSYNLAVREAIQMAEKQIPVDVLRVPVFAPTEAR